MKKTMRLALGMALAGLFLWLILRHISLPEIGRALTDARPAWVGYAVIVFFAGYACRIERWRLMLVQENPGLRWRGCAGPLMASVAANNVLPFRAGDLLRAFGFNRRLGISAATSLATLFIERMLDLLVVVSLLGLALAYFGMETSGFIGVGGGVLVAGGALILFLLLFPSSFKPLAFWLGRRVARFLPGLGQRLLDEFQKIFAALDHTSKGHTMALLVFWSVLAWIAEGLVFWFVALSLPSIGNHLAAWLALPVGTLATVIPSTPGFVGTFDFFTARAMTTLGNGAAAATAYAFLLHAVLWLPPSIVGGLYMLIRQARPEETAQVIQK